MTCRSRRLSNASGFPLGAPTSNAYSVLLLFGSGTFNGKSIQEAIAAAPLADRHAAAAEGT